MSEYDCILKNEEIKTKRAKATLTSRYLGYKITCDRCIYYETDDCKKYRKRKEGDYMTRLHIIYVITILLILIPIIAILVKYGNTPITVIPSWVFFLIESR